MADNEFDAWVENALGFRFQGAAGSGPEALGAAIAAWHDASDAVDGQIGSLQTALRNSDDEELREIGEYGLNAVTGGFKVKLMAALAGAERGVAGDVAKLAALVPQFRAHLEEDERVEACDDNPFGVAVSIRATLVPVLDQLARGLPA
jgi:hypothetical protein